MERKMKISYDAEVDAMYIRFGDEKCQVTAQRLSEDVAVNYSPDGRIVDIEILDASEYVFRPGDERKILLENLVAEAA